jgi:nitrile hydratase subunit beta
MNGVHDMGGMHNMGPIRPEHNEPVFHEPWEGRVYALVRAIGGWRKWNIDAFRFQRELIPPADYLRMSYYETWLATAVELMINKGLVTRAEIESGRPAPGSARMSPALTTEKVALLVAKGSPANRDVQVAARFRLGQEIRTRNINPEGHTRLPRYARAKLGTIDRSHGVFVFPDTNALFQGENPQHLYSVRFTAQELWGARAAAQDAVYLDLWEDYLEPVP